VCDAVRGTLDHTPPELAADIIERRREILAEEILELDSAVRERNEVEITQEAADVLFVAIGHVEALGKAGLSGVRYVTAKNAGKTDKTHAIRQDTGKLLPRYGKPHKWQ